MDAEQLKTARKALQDAIDLVGSQGGFARKLGKKQQHVSYWLKNNGIPAELAVQAEEAVDRKITRKQFRPDVFQAPN